MRVLSLALGAATLVFASLVFLSGCSAQTELRPGEVADYTSPDGAVSEFQADNRSAAVPFTGTTESGDAISADDYLGDVLVINFWYASCPPCRVEAPWLRELAETYAAKGVNFLGVNVRDGAATALSFAREFGIPYPSIIDGDSAIAMAFVKAAPLSAVPTTLVLDRKGQVAGRIVGLIDKATLDAIISRTLDEPSQ